MVSNSHFNKEILAKVVAKSAGVFKQAAILFFIGVSAGLDAFYVASSFCGIILALVAWSEVVVLPELSSAQKIRQPYVFLIFFKNIALISLFLSALTIVMGCTVYGSSFVGWLGLLACWAVFNVLNNCYLLLYRVQGNMDAVARYYRSSSIIGAILFVIGSSFLRLFSVGGDALVWLLALTILLPEIYFFILYFSRGRSRHLVRWRRGLHLLDFVSRYGGSSRSLTSLAVILLVFGIDAVDKYFSTLPSVAPNGASILVYGALIPLTARVALDAKTLFYTALSQNEGGVKAWGLMCQMHAKIMKIYAPLILLAALSCWLFGGYLLMLMGISSDNASAIIDVFYLYALLVPLYILWDFIYRIYHINRRVWSIIGLVVAGFSLNIVLNYVFVVAIGMGAAGIALSTLLVYLLYCAAGVVDIALRLKF